MQKAWEARNRTRLCNEVVEDNDSENSEMEDLTMITAHMQVMKRQIDHLGPKYGEDKRYKEANLDEYTLKGGTHNINTHLVLIDILSLFFN